MRLNLLRSLEMEEDKKLDGKHAIEEAMSVSFSFKRMSGELTVFFQVEPSCVTALAAKKVRPVFFFFARVNSQTNSFPISVSKASSRSLG